MNEFRNQFTVPRARVPLVLDVDGTLLRTDLLIETALLSLKENPFRLFQMMYWLIKGRSNLKRRLAETVSLETDLLPVNDELVAYAATEAETGREIYLATASDALVADRVAERFDFVAGVIASDGQTNLKGSRKAEALTARFPEGFDYAGDSSADLPVWKAARSAVVVNASKTLRRRAENAAPVVAEFRRPSQLQAAFKAARPHQWAKNVLVLAPLLLSGNFVVAEAVIATFLSFVALSVVASGTYIVNDLWDLAADRRHWSKRSRPIASGELSIKSAVVLVPILILGGMALAAVVGPEVLTGLACYLVITLAYSFRLKTVPLLDGFVLAALYSLRLAIGIAASGAPPSSWLIVFSMFLFSSLSLAKRYSELQRAVEAGNESIAGRGYQAKDAPLVMGFGIAAGTGAVLIMVLYIINDAFLHSFYGNVTWLWGFPVILHLLVSRIWLVCRRGELDDDPVWFAVRDRICLVLIGLLAVCFGIAWLA